MSTPAAFMFRTAACRTHFITNSLEIKTSFKIPFERVFVAAALVIFMHCRCSVSLRNPPEN